MVSRDAGAHEAGWVLVVGKETAHSRHVAFTESLGKGALVDDHDVVLEVCQAEFVF